MRSPFWRPGAAPKRSKNESATQPRFFIDSRSRFWSYVCGFGSKNPAFGSVSAPFRPPFAPLPWLTFGALWLTFGALGLTFARLGIQFLNFGALSVRMYIFLHIFEENLVKIHMFLEISHSPQGHPKTFQKRNLDFPSASFCWLQDSKLP